MPIKDIQSRTPTFPRIGVLRKGGEKQTNRPGEDLTYFRITSDHPEVVNKFHSVYGPQPREVNCYLPFKTTDQNFEYWYEEWASGRLVWRGDGEKVVIWHDKETNTYKQDPHPQPKDRGKPVGRLNVIIPELGRLGYVTVLTTSIHDITHLSRVLRGYESMRGDNGLVGIPFVIKRVPREISKPIGGKRVRSESWLLHLEVDPVFAEAAMESWRHDALSSPTSVASLPSPEDDIIEGEVMEDKPVNGESEDPIERPMLEDKSNGNVSELPVVRAIGAESVGDILDIMWENEKVQKTFQARNRLGDWWRKIRVGEDGETFDWNTTKNAMIVNAISTYVDNVPEKGVKESFFMVKAMLHSTDEELDEEE